MARLGWTSLRPVQELASHAILDGHNCIVLAPTAGGKTEASMFPVIAQLQSGRGVGALYIAPIKALLNNQAERLKTYTEMVGLDRFLWHGDVKASEKKRFLQDPCELLMTTPESLEVMLISGKANLFANLRFVVIDEIHALAGLDRGAHLMSVLQRLTTNDVQRIGLSATVGNPEAILEWLHGNSQRPKSVIDPPKQPSAREIRIALHPLKKELAEAAAQAAQGQKSLFFCQSRALSEEVAQEMRGRGTDVFVHHSSVALEERQAAEERFHHGRDTVIVCTSTLELGIDVGDLDKVLQANAPSTVSSFLQRMGRTGRRAGTRANTLFLCESAELMLQAAAIVELAKQGWVESVPRLTRCWPVLVHQLLAMTLQHQSVSADQCWEQLKAVPDFQGITHPEFQHLVDHLKATDFLYETGGLLSIGDQTEKVFGRKNFMELYAVFSTPQLYTVETPQKASIGSLEQTFVDTLVPEVSCFLLGGRGWVVQEVRHNDRTLVAHPAPVGRKPTWGGYLPQFLGFDLCQKMREILDSKDPLPYLDNQALDELRRTRVEEGFPTYAGGAVNQTLKYGLHILKGWSTTADNFRLRFLEEPPAAELQHALQELKRPDFWDARETQEKLLSSLPEYRLSKFQRALPHKYAIEMVRDYLIDIPRTLAFLA